MTGQHRAAASPRDRESVSAEADPSADQPFAPVKSDLLWVPDHDDGSGWAPVDWASAVTGSRYHYRHGAPWDEANVERPPYYRVVTRLESETLRPHENSYVVGRERLADFLAELALAGGAEAIWHVEACPAPPPESRAGGPDDA